MKNSKGISSICIVICLLFFLSLLVVNPWVITKLFGNLHSYYIRNIYKVQIILISTGLVFGIFGWLGVKSTIFSYCNKSKRKTNLTLLLVCGVSLLCFTEALLRIKPLQTTLELYDSSVPYENALFSRTRLPQENIKVPYPYLDNSINYILNQGYHGNEFPYNKPDDEVRIVVLGGSFIFGDQSELDWKSIESEYNRNWIQKVEQKLHQKGFDNVRIINAGIPGHTTFDSFGRLYSEIHLLDPDIILLCHGWNDIEYFADVSPENSLLRIMNPKPIQSRENASDVFEISQIYLRVKRKFQFKGLGVEGIKHKPEAGLTISEYSVAQFKLHLDLFIQTSKLIGAKPILLTQPRLIHEENTEDQRKKILYSFQRLGHDGICKSYRIIDSLIMETQIQDSIVISYDFAKPYIGVDSLFVDHVHLNEKGNEVMSNDLAKFLETILASSTKTSYNLQD